MSEEKTALEILKDFAKRTNRKIEYSSWSKRANAYSKIPISKRKVCIQNSDGHSTFFVSHRDDNKFGERAFYSGFFFPINTPTHVKINIRNKDILDKLNPFLKKNSFQSGSKSFDKKVMIHENDSNYAHRIFSKRKNQELTLSTLKLDGRYRIVVNPFEIDFVPELKNQSFFGILLSNGWEVNESKIESYFKIIEQFKNQISI